MHISPVSLRGHHLICLHFFNGEGYRPNFVANLRNILERAETGEQINICEGADDICSACPSLQEKRCRYSEDSEKEIKEMDRAAIELLHIQSHVKISWLAIKERIPEIFASWAGKFCRECDWFAVCRNNKVFTRLLDEKAQSEF
ncbi:MAG: DUF1284 domain-containing protein [Thermodesulfovibrionales bacterium]|nr:DUF1284 domain-containing protein [Thermodesulfovibrionales bacterium]